MVEFTIRCLQKSTHLVVSSHESINLKNSVGIPLVWAEKSSIDYHVTQTNKTFPEIADIA